MLRVSFCVVSDSTAVREVLEETGVKTGEVFVLSDPSAVCVVYIYIYL